MFEQYCEKLGSALAPHIEVGRDFSAADLGSSGYRAWTFSVRWSGNGKEDGCSPECKDVYKLFGTNTCKSDSDLVCLPHEIMSSYPRTTTVD